MAVRVRFFAQFRERYGPMREIELPPRTHILEAVRRVVDDDRAEDSVIDGTGQLREFAILMRNGVRIEKDEFETVFLEDGDEVAVFPPVAGG